MRLFISYSKADSRDIALHLRDALRDTLREANPDLRVWMDEALVPGDAWAEQIEREIDQCDHMIVLISPDIRRPRIDGQDYSFVRKEIAYARESGKSIIPLMVAPTRLPIEITDLEYIDFIADRERGMEALLAFIFAQPAARSATEGEQSAEIRGESAVKRASIRWGEAPDVTDFLGRDAEQETLLRWIKTERCHVAAIFGMGGLGKSSLAAKLVEQLQGDFDHIVWQSLRNAPKPDEVYADLLRFLSPPGRSEKADAGDALDFEALLNLLRQRRCLIVLDNFDTVFQLHQQRTGAYLEGYEDYGEFVRLVSEASHKSCILITSRERPRELAANTATVHLLNLGGLGEGEGTTMLDSQRLTGSAAAKTTLVSRYGGNPLALKLVATTIEETFGRNVDQFLAQGSILFDDIQDILEQQINRVSDLELTVMHWLAVYREPRPLIDFEADIIPRPDRDDLLNALKSLVRRSLIESTAAGFTLQNVVMEYMTARLIDRICDEFTRLIAQSEAAETAEVTLSRDSLLNRIPLIQATAKDYLRDTQRRLTLTPILDKLGYIYDGVANVRAHFSTHLKRAAGRMGKSAGYANGSIINALAHMNFDFTGADFSNITLWGAFLRDIELHGINFSGSDISRTVFTETISSIFAVALSPRRDILAMGGYAGDIHLWRIADKTKLATFDGHKRPVWSLAFSPDDRILASSGDDHTVRLWDVDTGACIHTFEGHASWVRAIAFHPNGNILASASGDHTLRLWDIATGECLNVLEGHTGGVRGVAFHPDGQTLASASGDHSIRLWDVTSGECVNVLSGREGGHHSGHDGFVFAVSYSPDGKYLASAGADRRVHLWDVTDRRRVTLLARLNDHTNEVHAVAFSADSKLLVSGGQDKIIRLWHIRSKTDIAAYATLTGHTSWVWSLAFKAAQLDDADIETPNYTLVSGSADQTVKIWEIKGANEGKCIATWKGRTDWVRSVAFTPDGTRLVSGSADYLVRVWDLARGQSIMTLDKHFDQVHSVAVSPDNRTVASAGWDGIIHLWDIVAGRHLHSLTEHSSTPWSVAFSPDGTLLASGGNDSAVKLWDVATGACLATFTDHTAQVYGVAFSPDGKVLASGSFDSTVKLWQVEARRPVGTLRVNGESLITCVAFSPDGSFLAAGNRNNIIDLWDMRVPAHIATLEGHMGWIYAVAFDPGGRYLASGSGDNTVRLWDVAQRSTRRILRGHQSWVHSVAFSPDGARLASGSKDETIRLYDVLTGEVESVLKARKQYEGMNITGVTGLSEAQINTLISLGAIQKQEDLFT